MGKNNGVMIINNSKRTREDYLNIREESKKEYNRYLKFFEKIFPDSEVDKMQKRHNISNRFETRKQSL